jgi:subtilase-type serine protease
MGRYGVTPYAAVQAQWLSVPGYAETSVGGPANFALRYAAQDQNEARSEFGFRADAVLASGRGWLLTARTRAAWAHEFADITPVATAGFLALPGTSFAVSGAPLARDAALLTLGGELKLGRSLSMLAKFDGTFAGSANVYAGSGTVRWIW